MPRADWIDASGANDATLLLTGDRFWPSAWQELFWNESIRQVARVRGAESPGLIPQVLVSPRADGQLETAAGTTLDPDYLAAPPTSRSPASVSPTCRERRTSRESRSGGRSIPCASGSASPGSGRTATSTAASPRGSRCSRAGRDGSSSRSSGKQGLPTRVLLDGQVVAERAIPPGRVWRPSIAAPASADGTGACVFELQTDGLIGSTRVEWVPEATS